MKQSNACRYVFGPVPSRRLGRSLGVDLVPFKTCTYDCVYCQIGRTTNKTVERREYVPVAKVLSDVRRKLTRCKPNYVTLSGSGEPTLHARLGELIQGLKNMTRIPVAVLTNGSLLGDRDVQAALRLADLVIPSLDGGDEAAFQYVNRPHAAITFERMVKGLVDFRARYSGALWLEVFLLGGVTASKIEATKIATLARRLRPDKIQLNTVTRPPAEDFAFPVPAARMKQLCRVFGGKAEVIADYQTPALDSGGEPDADDVLTLLGRRPCTVKDIADGLGLHATQAAKLIEHLHDAGQVVEQRVNGRAYFSSMKKRAGTPPPGPVGRTQKTRG